MNLPLTVYTPESPLKNPARLLREMFRDLLASRELAWRLFVRDTSAQYRQSILGYAWAFIPPLVASLPFVFLNSQGVVAIKGTSKKFCCSLKKSLLYGVSDIARDLNPFARHNSAPTSDLRSLPSGLRPDEFWAVNDVSFELKRGECLGLIGRNGAGKTTLLKMLNGLIKPDKGRIEMRGREG